MTVYWPNGELAIPRVTSEFDAARKNPVTGVVQPHNGIDLIGWQDNRSPVDGTVIFAGYNGAAGNEVRIRADGPTAFHVGDCFRILHHASLYVRTGDRVKARQAVGRMGTTGQSTGVHCHFETHESRLWNYVNPRDFMARANAGGSPAGGGSTPFGGLSMADINDIMASLDNISTVIGGIQNAIGDPNIGILKNAATAADKSTAGLAATNNAERIVSEIRNAIGDPNIGLLVAANDARATSRATLDAVGKLSAGAVDIDVKALADELRAELGADVAAELAKRLAE